MATVRHLEQAGIMFAGSGQNLAEARRPGYLDTRAGRVALVATTATYRPWNAASAAAAGHARAARHQSAQFRDDLYR